MAYIPFPDNGFNFPEFENPCIHEFLSSSVRRIFGEAFTVVWRYPSKREFVTRLNDFYYQFQRIGNNYNQVAKDINTHFSQATIHRQVAAPEQGQAS